MVLVRKPFGGKPRAYRIDAFEAVTTGWRIICYGQKRRRTPRAWWMSEKVCIGRTRVIGAAAIANSVDEAHQLIECLKETPE